MESLPPFLDHTKIQIRLNEIRYTRIKRRPDLRVTGAEQKQA